MRVQACGVCHTDLHYREGAINDDFPFLLGHEAAGVVERVGADVTNVAPGDFVILAWAGSLRQLPVLPARPAVVLLRQPQRAAEDDPRRWLAAVPRAGHWRVLRVDTGRRVASRQGRPVRQPAGCRSHRLRRHGRPWVLP